MSECVCVCVSECVCVIVRPVWAESRTGASLGPVLPEKFMYFGPGMLVLEDSVTHGLLTRTCKCVETRTRTDMGHSWD